MCVCCTVQLLSGFQHFGGVLHYNSPIEAQSFITIWTRVVIQLIYFLIYAHWFLFYCFFLIIGKFFITLASILFVFQYQLLFELRVLNLPGNKEVLNKISLLKKYASKQFIYCLSNQKQKSIHCCVGLLCLFIETMYYLFIFFINILFINVKWIYF